MKNHLLATRKEFSRNNIDKEAYIREMHKGYAPLFELAEYIAAHNNDIAEINVKADGVTLTTREHNIRLTWAATHTRTAPVEILNFDCYESDASYWLMRCMQDGFTIFDIGANVGWYSILFAKHFPNAQIHAFEPIPETFKYLEKNITINEVDNVVPHHFALGNESGQLQFYYEPQYAVRASAADLSDNASAQVLTCDVRTLDDYCGEEFSHIDFMKCDCEGAEYLIFQGGSETISKHKPIIFTEMLRKWSAKFSYHPNDIIAFFSEKEYRCFVSAGQALRPFDKVTDETSETNYFFLHEKKHADWIREYVK